MPTTLADAREAKDVVRAHYARGARVVSVGVTRTDDGYGVVVHITLDAGAGLPDPDPAWTFAVIVREVVGDPKLA